MESNSVRRLIDTKLRTYNHSTTELYALYSTQVGLTLQLLYYIMKNGLSNGYNNEYINTNNVLVYIYIYRL